MVEPRSALVLAGLLAVAAAGCGSPTDGSPIEVATAEAHVAPPPPPPRPRTPVETPAPPPPLTFAVLSDLHLPNDHQPQVRQLVAALIDLRVRFVVITGDHTNGSDHDGPHRRAGIGRWYQVITDILRPLRDAGIGVLPVAGNHDSYLEFQRDAYFEAFGDLDAWAGPVQINPPQERAYSRLARPPFSYSADVDGVHLSLTHIVTGHLEPDVEAWLAEDLAGAQRARHRLVFGHVPMATVVGRFGPRRSFIADFGGLLEQGEVEAYVAGHEHVVWDEDVRLASGGTLRQVLVGCSSGFYNYEPSAREKQRARCHHVDRHGLIDALACRMPNGAGGFVLSRGRKNRELQEHLNSFTLFTIDGARTEVRPMTIDARGRAVDFYQD
ncbi:MAG TPA: metallophosphoesterase [Kofleriaceae bacterium]|nr:metallophosphoesterase [Kofleriaceae bacterium]